MAGRMQHSPPMINWNAPAPPSLLLRFRAIVSRTLSQTEILTSWFRIPPGEKLLGVHVAGAERAWCSVIDWKPTAYSLSAKGKGTKSVYVSHVLRTNTLTDNIYGAEGLRRLAFAGMN